MSTIGNAEPQQALGAGPAAIGCLDDGVDERAETGDRQQARRSGRAPSGCGSRDFGSRMYPATSATAMIGTLTKNTEPHEKCSSRNPLATGPTAAPPPEMPAQMAIALPRSCGGKTLVRIDSVAGMTNAAPRPMTARPTMIAVGAVAERRRTASRTGTPTRPACSAPLRPKRSPMVPAVSSRPAKTRP